MREHPPTQAASVRRTAQAFSIPARHLYVAIGRDELKTYSTGGRTNLLIFDHVKAWLMTKPAAMRPHLRGPRHAVS
jgi:hypothetical protein